jgi:TonB family protein
VTRSLGPAVALSVLVHGGAVATIDSLGALWRAGAPPARAPALYVDLVEPVLAASERVVTRAAPEPRPRGRERVLGSVARAPAPPRAPTDASEGPSAVALEPREPSEKSPSAPAIATPEVARPPVAPVAPAPPRAPTDVPARPNAVTLEAREPADRAPGGPAMATPEIARAPGPVVSESRSAPPAPSPVAAPGMTAVPEPPAATGTPARTAHTATAPALPPSEAIATTAPSAPPLSAARRDGKTRAAASAAPDERGTGAGSGLPSEATSTGEPFGPGAQGGEEGRPSGVARFVPGDAPPVHGGGIPPEYEAYVRALRQRVQDRLVYPWTAVRRGQQGVVELEVRVGAEGGLVGVEVMAGPSAATLRAAAVTAVRGAAPFPFPPGVAGRPLVIRLPVEFQLR